MTIRKTKFRLIISDSEKPHKVICSLSYDPLSVSSNEFHLYGVQIDWPLGCLDLAFLLVGYCNGLVCIWSQLKKFFGLWNPYNNESKDLPKSPNKPWGSMDFPYAFGYDHKTGDHKLICLYFELQGKYLVVDVYIIGPKSWKSTRVSLYIIEQGSGMLVNRVFHWMGRRMDRFFEEIISLDISNETFKELQPPEVSLEERTWGLGVGVLKECLCILAYDIVNVEVWVMQDYGVQESWTRHYTITHDRIVKDRHLRPMWSFISGEILFVNSVWYCADLVLYDPNVHVENQTFKFPKAMNTFILVPLDFST